MAASGGFDRPPPPAAFPVHQYPEMIMAAIDALNEPNGSNKSSISKHMETVSGDLHPFHATLLTHHLNRMRATGQLLFLKNNYLKPDPNAPPRRGRGRPPKPKTPLPPGAELPPSGSSGSASHPPTAPLSGRKRGRPPKDATKSAIRPPPTPAGGAPRGRGRPPKVKPPIE